MFEAADRRLREPCPQCIPLCCPCLSSFGHDMSSTTISYNGTSSANQSSDLYQHVFWTTIGLGIFLAVAFALAMYLNDYFQPTADFYEDCGPGEVKFMYTVRFEIRDLPASFLSGGKSVVVILQHQKVCICRWKLQLQSRESALTSSGRNNNKVSKYKLKVGRNSILRDMDSVRLEHNSFGQELHMESIEITDRSSNQVVFRSGITSPITMLPIVCYEDQRQVFPAAPVPGSGPDQRTMAIRRKISPPEYFVFIFFAISILLFCSLHLPYQNITKLRAIVNGLTGAAIALLVTLTTFVVYKMVIRPLFEAVLFRLMSLSLLVVMAILVSVVAVLHSQDKGPESSGFWWLSGLCVGLLVIIFGGIFLAYLFSLITRLLGGRNEIPFTTTQSTVSEKRVSAIPTPPNSNPNATTTIPAPVK